MKKYEYRRKFLKTPVRAFISVSSPIKEIRGYIEFGEPIIDTIERIGQIAEQERTGGAFGILKYMQGLETGLAIPIKSIREIEPIPLVELRERYNFAVPQSYMNVDSNPKLKQVLVQRLLCTNPIAFPIVVDGKTKKTAFPATTTSRDMDLLRKAKLGLMRKVEKSRKWYAQISVEVPTSETSHEGIMGIDFGLKVPAVAVTTTGKTRVFGNGRLNKYIRRKYQQRRRKLGKLKKLTAIRKLGNKEQRWMKDQNHKMSRQMVNTAIQEGGPSQESQ
ncbi:hypothetical protein [Paenibacillus sp. J2TS4]|uniref:hypothetical protein n=1 Tax=Paenibacillus sp. J2TS4 TaxID=2807194 RepID=UPI0020C0D6FE|nr:hypothetical protein [Paenibacillus sp. J2TS4]